MERSYQAQSFFERLLARWGGAYILRVPYVALLVSDLLGLVGIYYIIAATSLNKSQVSQLIISTLVFVTLANLFIRIYIAITTSTARARLDSLIKGKHVISDKSQVEIENISWHEVHNLPSRIVIVEALTIYFLVVLPVVIFMLWVGGAETIQVVHIAIGGILSGTTVVIHNSLFLERILVPVRQTLFPSIPEVKKPSLGLRLQTRLLGIIALLILTTIIMLGGIGFQKSINASLPGADVPYEIAQFQKQATVLGLMILALGLFLGRMITQSISLPIKEIISTLERVQMGDLSTRAKILASDETSHLTLQLNQLLSQLMAAQANLEKQVEERTADLNRKTAQLQAAARVSRDVSVARDVNTLLWRTVDLVSDHFGFYHTGIYFLDASGEYAVLQAASSEGGKKMIARGYRLEIGQRGAIGIAAYENRPHIVMDAGQDAPFEENPDLPMTRSQIVFPLAPRGKVIGMLDIQSTQQSGFSSDDIELLQSLADQVALAIQNAQLMEESHSALEQLEAALSENVRRAWSERGGEQKHAYRYTPTGLSAAHSIEEEKKTEEADAAPISVPIALRGQPIGNIVLHRKGENTWSDTDRSLAAEVANQIGLALENSRLLQEAQQRAILEQTLSGLTARLGRSVDADTLLQTTVKELRQLPNVTEVSVFLTPPESTTPGEKS